MSAGECQTSNRGDYDEEEKEDAPPPLDEGDIALLKSYGLGPYSVTIKTLEEEIKKHQQTVKDLIGIKESDTGLSPPSMWDLVGDKQMMAEEAPLQVARCTKIIAGEGDDTDNNNGGGGGAAAANSSNAAGNKYVINVKQMAKFVVGLGEKVAPTDIEEGMRVGVDRSKYSIQIPLPPKIDPTVSLMTVEDKPDVTYDDVGGAKDAMEKLREVLEMPLLHPERFVTLGIEPPKGVLLYGPPGTGMFFDLFLSRDREREHKRLPCSYLTIFIFLTRQNFGCSCRGQPHRCLFYPCNWFGIGPKIRGRGSPNGPRTLHDGPFQARYVCIVRFCQCFVPISECRLV